jgi:curli production assembly/transport component CsgG
MKRFLITLPFAVLLSGCVGAIHPDINQSYLTRSNAQVSDTAQRGVFDGLAELDGAPIPIAIYSFIDRTGQRRNSQTVSSFSTAVTQGADAYVIKTLAEVGNGKWFRPVERVGIDSIIKERQLIRQMREQQQGEAAEPLPPLMVSGIILEGGIIDYNSNIKTGGQGMRYLGIGPHTQYMEDQVVIHMRLVSVQTGEVLTTVTVEKNLLSTSEGITAFKFFNLATNAFELDAQQTSNEPGNYAIRSAIETGVKQLIINGEKRGLWKFKSVAEGEANESN